MMKKLNKAPGTRWSLHTYFLILLAFFLFIPTQGLGYIAKDLDDALTKGNIASAKGDYKRAIAEFLKAVTISESLFGEEHVKTTLCYNNLGLAYKDNAEYDKAISYLEKALAIRIKLLGTEHPDVATSYNNLG
jgi:tetratricopeptide (TPR) repeat protein